MWKPFPTACCICALTLVHAFIQGEKTRQELLNDIIAKSKERKLEKARDKEEQESERERLDDGMGELLGMLHQRPSKGERNAVQNKADDYDLTMRVSFSTFIEFILQPISAFLSYPFYSSDKHGGIHGSWNAANQCSRWQRIRQQRARHDRIP